MIFKKPYGFLIKHFKLIHLFLTGIYIYLLIKVNKILNYFTSFLGGKANRLEAIKIANNYYLIAVIGSIIICIIIYALMHYKKKPKLLYPILIALYIVVSIIIGFVYNGLNQIYIYNTIELKTLRLYCDILRITMLFQYISIGFTLVRGLGFDIKKFNFKEDIADLGLNEEDEEEVELSLESNRGVLRKLREKIREYTYYYKENKLMILVILTIIIIVVSISIILDIKLINKVYKENETFKTETFSITVTRSFITNKNYNNINLNTNGNTYVIVKLYLYPLVRGSKFNTANIALYNGKERYSVEQKNNNNFKDLGTLYVDQRLQSGQSYILAFNIPETEINNKLQLQYSKKFKIKLSPKNIDEPAQEKAKKLKETLSLNNSILGSGTITINSVEIKNTFSYDYNYEADGKTYSSKISIKSNTNTLLNIKGSYSLPNYTLYELIDTYGVIKYKINDEEHTSRQLSNKTPGNYKGGLFLEVDKDIEQASKIWLELTIRNRTYTYYLK